MVVSTFSSNGYSGFETLLNHGDGTFTVGPAFGIGSISVPNSKSAVGDFNGDGSLDVVYPAMTSIPGLYRLQVALDQGNGKFVLGAKFAYLVTFNDIVVGDFNQDGVLDVVVNQNGFTTALFLGNGDGTFRAGSTLPISPGRLLAADLNGDGKLDLVSESTRNNGVTQTTEIQEWLGNGDGTFQKQKTVVVLPGALSNAYIYVTDLNGDGKEDLVFFDTANNIWAVLGNGDGSFRKANIYASNGGAIFVGDFNSDGKVDIFLEDQLSQNLLLLLGNGDGTFGSPQTITATPGVTINAVGDFNADGLLDFAGFSLDIQVYLQN